MAIRKAGSNNHRSARNQLELNKLRTYGIRERGFNMQQVRQDAVTRRGRHLNMSALKSQDGVTAAL